MSENKSSRNATFVRELQRGEGWKYKASLYVLSHPIAYEKSPRDISEGVTNYVVVSERPAEAGKVPEVILFPAKMDGTIVYETGNPKFRTVSGRYLKKVVKDGSIPEPVKFAFDELDYEYIGPSETVNG